jgi:hypothetical protein
MAKKSKEVKEPVFKIGSALWTEKDRIKSINIKDEDGNEWEFQIKAILPSDLIQIGRRTAILRGGVPFDSIDASTNEWIERQATLEFGLVGFPDWFDIVECVDGDLLSYLYNQIYLWSTSFKEGLKKNKHTERSEEK